MKKKHTLVPVLAWGATYYYYYYHWYNYNWHPQVNSLFVTTSSYPNRKTLIYREEFCIVTNRLIKKCKSYKRKPLDREYPNICNLIQPLEDVEWVLSIWCNFYNASAFLHFWRKNKKKKKQRWPYSYEKVA